MSLRNEVGVSQWFITLCDSDIVDCWDYLMFNKIFLEFYIYICYLDNAIEMFTTIFLSHHIVLLWMYSYDYGNFYEILVAMILLLGMFHLLF